MRNTRSCVPKPDEFVTPCGSRIHQLRELHFDGSKTELVVVGEEDIQDRIEAYGPFTDLNYMLTRLAHGDQTVLTSNVPIYGDVSEFPRNPIEAINLIRDAESQFAALPPNERLEYNNDWKVWLTQLMTPLEPSVAPHVQPVDDPVKEEEVGNIV